jgi:MFS family permease
MLIFLLIGGVAVDRFSRARIMLLSDIGRGLLMCGVAALAYLNRLEVRHIYAAAFVFGFVDAFFQPAYTALVPAVTPPDDLPSANSLTNLSWQVTGVGGPAIGAFIVAAGGTPLAFALDALSFFISAALLLPLLPLSPAPKPEAGAPPPNALAELGAGFKIILAEPWLWITIAVFGVINAADAAPFGVALPFLIKDTLHLDVAALGALQSLFSAGSVAAALWLGRLPRLRRRGLIGYVTTIITGLCTLSFGLPISIYGLGLAAFVRGIGYATFGLIWTNTLQEMVPGDKLGRVSSIDWLGSLIAMPVGFALVGWATDRVGPPLVFVVGGSITVVMVMLALLHPRIRHLD